MNVGIVHPGAMGAVVGGQLVGRRGGTSVAWASHGRSDATRYRAAEHGLTDLGGLAELVDAVDVIVSICPPHAALAVGESVADLGFRGIFVDANAISPDSSRTVAGHFERFVDAAIVGPPPTEAGTTRLYLAGAEAGAVAGLWQGSRLEARVLEGDIGAASALKMAYAGWTKGSAALLLAVRAYAEEEGVGRQLTDEWDLSIPGLSDRVAATAAGVGPKAWRFRAEMDEIAGALGRRDLPHGFHRAAAEIFGRLASLRGRTEPTLDELLELLAEAGGSSS